MLILGNSGIPMLALIAPWMILWLVPIIVIESWIASHVTLRPAASVIGGVSLANAVSTFVGIPITWIVALGLQLLLDLAGLPQGQGKLAPVIEGALFPAWLAPTRGLDVMIPAAVLVLTAGFFVASYFSERAVLRRMWRSTPRRLTDRACWVCNVTTYGVWTMAWLIVLVLGKGTRALDFVDSMF